jgi:hypothetical protein
MPGKRVEINLVAIGEWGQASRQDAIKVNFAHDLPFAVQ